MGVLDDAKGLARGALALREKVLAVMLALVAVAALWGWGLAISRGWRVDAAVASSGACATRESAALAAAKTAGQSISMLSEVNRQCVAENARLGVENAGAVEEALLKGVAAGREREQYERALEKGATNDQCRAFLESKVCPALMGY